MSKSGNKKISPDTEWYLKTVFEDETAFNLEEHSVALDYASMLEGALTAHEDYRQSKERSALTLRVKEFSKQQKTKALKSLEAKTPKRRPRDENELPLGETLDLKLTTVANLNWKNLTHLHEMYRGIWAEEFDEWETKCARLLAKVYHLGQKKLREMHIEETPQRIQKSLNETQTLRDDRSTMVEGSLDRAFTIKSNRLQGIKLNHKGQEVSLYNENLTCK